tara:strand:+ start:353 stop:1045 length:693 start_codon:yes stop_codon:yes gene_type:complete
MKKLLWTLTLALTSSVAFAQSTSVVVESAANDSTMGKTGNIEQRVKNDLQIIEDQAEKWNDHIYGEKKTYNPDGSVKSTVITNSNSAIKKLNTTKTQISTVIGLLNERQEEFLPSETDPRGATYEEHATKPVPVCSGDKPRLVYKSNEWHCLAPIGCGVINGSGQTGWEQTEDGKCQRKAGYWEVGNWKSCSGTTQTREVDCLEEGSKEPIANNHCSSPSPLATRTCAQY